MSPDAVACRHLDGEAWVDTTWRELRDETARVAGYWRRHGLRRGDRIAILAPTCRAWYVCELAGLRLGLVIVGIDHHQKPARIASILDESGATALVVGEIGQWWDIDAERRARFTLAMTMEDVGHDGVAGWQQVSRAERPPADEAARVAPDDSATLIYTSSTTGAAKAVEFTHAQLIQACGAIIRTYPQLNEGDAMVCWLPLAHMVQRMTNLFGMARGATTWFADDPRKVVATMAVARPSIICGVPRFYEKIAEKIGHRIEEMKGPRRRLVDAALETGRRMAQHRVHGQRPSIFLRMAHATLDRLVLSRFREALGGRLEVMVTGTAPAPAWVLEFFDQIGLLLLEVYGLSENAVPMSSNRADAYRFGSVGMPLPYNEIRIAPDGEILVRGPGVLDGYFEGANGHDDADPTRPRDQARFTDDGYLCTGDLGRYDEDGFLYLTGRKSEIIKTSTGRRISPARVEAIYGRSRLFDQVMVVGNGRKCLAALLALNQQAVERELMKSGHRIPGDPAAMAQSKDVAAIVHDELKRHETELADYERVIAYHLLEQPLSVEDGDLTPTLKLRRSRVEARLGDLIDAVYEREPDLPVAKGPEPEPTLAEVAA